jgi:hypothetical protein
MSEPERYSGRPPKRGRGVWILIAMVVLALLIARLFGFVA